MMKGDEAIRRDFEPLQRRLNEVLARYVPASENLHFAQIVPDSAFFNGVRTLSSDGLEAVVRNGSYFAEASIYEPQFWYELLLLIARGAVGPGAESVGERGEIENLADTLVDIARFTQQHPGNDIWKRNREALGNLTLAFPELSLAERARNRATNLGEPVIVFVEDTLTAVEEARERRDKAD